MKWDTWTRGTIHPYRADIIMRGLACSRLSDFKTLRALYINNRGNLWWSWHHKDLLDLGTKLKIVLNSPNGAAKHFRMFDKYSVPAFVESRLIQEKNLRSLSSQELVGLYDRLFLAAYPANIILAADIDAFDTLLEDFFRSQIIRELLKHCLPFEAEEIYKIIAAPAYRTYVNKQEVMVLEAALKQSNLDSAARKIWEKFWWTNMGWENMRPHSLAYFKNLIRQRAKKKGLIEEINFLKTTARRHRQVRAGYFKRLHLPIRLKYWLEVLDRYAYYHDLRKELECRSLYAFHRLMLEVARRLRLRSEDLEWLWHHEIKTLLEGKKPDLQEIKRRRDWAAAITWPPRLSFYSGLTAKKIKDRELPVKGISVSEFKGLGATPGRVRGRVKVWGSLKLCGKLSEAIF